MMSAPFPAPINVPLIVTALMGADDFAHFDGLRRAHFPPERNAIPAHITLFHHLPPARLQELAGLLHDLTIRPPPPAKIVDVLFLGRGNAFRVESPELMTLRQHVAEWFAADLTAQDQQTPRLHITVQNKVAPDVARALHASLQASFRPRPLAISGIAIWAYRGGPWDLVRRLPFRGRRGHRHA
jgi:hypothetical protein